MLTNTWRRFRSPAAWAFAIVLGVPMLAEAQQGGLFPLAPTRHRPRVPCEMEDPVYGLYRNEYYGYHPTCWRRFPAGWGCPTPEAPNAAAEFQNRPRDPAPLGNPPAGDAEAPMPGPGAAPDEATVPPLPDSGRTPFQLDRGGEKPPPSGPGARPPANPNPLELPAPPAEEPAKPAADGGLPPTGLLDTPVQPGGDAAPLLALPEPGAAPAAPSGPPMLPPGVNQANPLIRPAPSTYVPPQPVQAPRRTSLLGGLFGGASRSRR